MKLSVLLFLMFGISQAQIHNYEVTRQEIVSDILRYETMDKGELAIVSKIDSSYVEYLLKPLIEQPYISKFNNNDESVMLIKSDIDYLVKSIREQYQNEWKENYFNHIKVIDESEMMNYLQKDSNNQIVMISKPIFIKSDNIVFVYFKNLCCVGIYGNSSLALYKKVNGLWKKWFVLSGGSF